MIKIIILLTLLHSIHNLKLFLLGWTTSDQDPQIYDAIAASTNKPPLPKQCDQQWTTTKCPKIAVITSAASSQQEGNYTYQTDVNQESIGHGLSPQHVLIHIDNYLNNTNPDTPIGQYNYQIITQADIIYFDGGDQSRHARCWLSDDQQPNQYLSIIKDRALRDDVVLAGTSAGSMIMSPSAFGGGRSFGIWYFANSVGLAQKRVKDGQVGGSGLDDTRNGTDCLQYDQNGGKIKGFGLVDFLVDTHFQVRGRLGRIVPSLVDMKMNVGVGVDVATAIYITNTSGKVIGKNAVYIVDITNAKVPTPLKYFQIRGVTTHYLTSNDIYHFHNQSVLSSKPIINTPYYNLPTDSNDILNPGQCKLLINRLVDQKASYNIGRTTVPTTQYPSDTPRFEMLFYKSASSKGYYHDGKYSVEKVLIDYDYLSK